MSYGEHINRSTTGWQILYLDTMSHAVPVAKKRGPTMKTQEAYLSNFLLCIILPCPRERR
jgi:hypothetical protein